MTLTQKHQEKVRELIDLTREMDELRVEVGVKENVKTKLVRNRLTWAGLVERIRDEKLTKRANVQKVEGKGG